MRRAAVVVSLLAYGCVFALFGVFLWQGAPSLASLQVFQGEYWDFRNGLYSAASMVFGSLFVTATALALSVPLGLGTALFLSECLRGRVRLVAKVAVETLAVIPSVVYGLIGAGWLNVWLEGPSSRLGGESGTNLLAGGLILAAMILPTVVTFMDDALCAVPFKVRTQGYALGFDRASLAWRFLLPLARKGLVGAVLLALGRAFGETIAVYMVIGRSDRPLEVSLPSVLSAGQTLTTKIGGAELSIAYGSSAHWGALMGLGLMLIVVVAIAVLTAKGLGGARQGRSAT